MTSKQEEKIDNLADQVSKLVVAIGGDPTLGTKDIVEKVRETNIRINETDELVAKHIAKYESDRAKVVGIAVTASAILTSVGGFVLWLLD